MKTTVSHLQINIDPQNKAFYKELTDFLGMKVLYEDDSVLGVLGSEGGTALWFTPLTKPVANDYDGPGANHIAIWVDSTQAVDSATRYLEGHGVPALFETPRHRKEFSSGPDHTYYQVMFETPDRILFEVVYEGPFQN